MKDKYLGSFEGKLRYLPWNMLRETIIYIKTKIRWLKYIAFNIIALKKIINK